eukprot:scaffold78179_cov29-Tisochrysis_lutea.AAC.2
MLLALVSEEMRCIVLVPAASLLATRLLAREVTWSPPCIAMCRFTSVMTSRIWAFTAVQPPSHPSACNRLISES